MDIRRLIKPYLRTTHDGKEVTIFSTPDILVDKYIAIRNDRINFTDTKYILSAKESEILKTAILMEKLKKKLKKPVKSLSIDTVDGLHYTVKQQNRLFKTIEPSGPKRDISLYEIFKASCHLFDSNLKTHYNTNSTTSFIYWELIRNTSDKKRNRIYENMVKLLTGNK